MPEKLTPERLHEISTTAERHARDVGEIWVSESEIHVMAEELLELRAELITAEDEIDRMRKAAKEYRVLFLKTGQLLFLKTGQRTTKLDEAVDTVLAKELK